MTAFLERFYYNKSQEWNGNVVNTLMCYTYTQTHAYTLWNSIHKNQFTSIEQHSVLFFFLFLCIDKRISFCPYFEYEYHMKNSYERMTSHYVSGNRMRYYVSNSFIWIWIVCRYCVIFWIYLSSRPSYWISLYESRILYYVIEGKKIDYQQFIIPRNKNNIMYLVCVCAYATLSKYSQ